MPIKPVSNAIMPDQTYVLTTTANSLSAYQEKLGQTCDFPDVDIVAGITTQNSQLTRTAVLVQNLSGGNLSAGEALYWVGGSWQTGVTGCPNGSQVRCFVPGYMNGSSANVVPNLAFFYAYYHGEMSALSDGTAINIGDGLVVGATTGELCTDNSANNALLYTLAAPSAAITNTATLTTFSNGTYTFAANSLKKNDVIRFRAEVPITWAAGQLTLTVYLGTTAIMTTGAITNATGDVFYVDGEIEILTVGSSGTMLAAGTYVDGIVGGVTTSAVSGATGREFYLASGTALNTTIAQSLTVQAQWSTANSGDSVVLNLFDVWRTNILNTGLKCATALASAASSTAAQLFRIAAACPW